MTLNTAMKTRRRVRFSGRNHGDSNVVRLPTIPSAKADPTSRRGFTFLEVLFAIMILGIGFILVAAMFPAAIKQTQATVEDSTASSVWLSMHRKIIEMARAHGPVSTQYPVGFYVLDQDIPANGQVWAFNDIRLGPQQHQQLTDFIGAELILDTDQRYGCVPLFQRPLPATGATVKPAEVQLFLIPVRCRNKTQYDLSDASGNLSATLFNSVRIKGGPGGTISTGITNDNTAAGTGAYVVISDAPGGQANGNIYRLGERLSPGVFGIAPDSQNAADSMSATTNYTAKAFIVGRALAIGSPGNYDGPVQDVGIAVTPIRVRP